MHDMLKRETDLEDNDNSSEEDEHISTIVY